VYLYKFIYRFNFAASIGDYKAVCWRIHACFCGHATWRHVLGGAVWPFGRRLGWRRCTASQLVFSCFLVSRFFIH